MSGTALPRGARSAVSAISSAHDLGALRSPIAKDSFFLKKKRCENFPIS